MKRLNHFLATAALILFAVHALAGVAILTGLYYVPLKWLSYVLFAVVIAHAGVSIALSLQAFRAGARSGKWYVGENAVFWIKRISGFAMLFMIFFHMNTYTYTSGDFFELKQFTLLRLISQLVFAAVVFLHIFISIKGYLINKGVTKIRQGTLTLCLAFAILLLLVIVSYVVYFWAWNVSGIYS